MGTKYYSLLTYHVMPLVARFTSSYDHVGKKKTTTKQESLKERDSVLKSINYVVPKHMAVIMDGNRRFARKKYGIGHELRGHRAGGELLHDFIGWCQDYGVKVLTVYAFSTENWKRPKNEVDGLMNVFVEQCPKIKSGCMDRGVRVRVVASDFQRLEPRVQKMFRELEEATKDCTAFHLNLCVSYGGRGEITNAARRVCSDVAKGKIRSANEILEADLDRYMLTHGFPDPDLVLRTSGEHRLSNFLLWQLAYSEMVFVQKHWPELEECDFVNILRTFSGRKRRFGK